MIQEVMVPAIKMFTQLLTLRFFLNDIPHAVGVFEGVKPVVSGVQVGGMSVSAPVEVLAIARANPELTREQRVQAVAETSWAKNLAKGQLRVMGIPETDPNYRMYLTNYARRVAEGLV